MHPQPQRIQSLAFGMVEKVVHSLHHRLGHLLVAALEPIYSVEKMPFFDAHQRLFRPMSYEPYFLMEVMMYLRVADIVISGTVLMGSGSRIQQLSLR